LLHPRYLIQKRSNGLVLKVECVAKKFKVGDNKFEYGVIYKIKTDKGYFTLRNKSASMLSSRSFFRVRKNTSLASSKVKSSSLYQTPLCIASNLSDGSKPRWTIDVPKEILGLKNGKEIKFK
jgi:hypothetical protein